MTTFSTIASVVFRLSLVLGDQLGTLNRSCSIDFF